MPKKNVVIFIIAAVVMLSSFSLLFSSSGASPSSPSAAPSVSVASTWTGNLVIYANGTLSTSAAPVMVSGNNYTLTGNISGSVQIHRVGALFDGNGFTIQDYDGMSPLQLIGGNHITVENTNVVSTWSAGINVYQSSYDKVLNNTVTGMTSGIFVYAPYNDIINNTVNITLTCSCYSGTPVGIVTHGSYTMIEGNSIYIPRSSDGIVVDSQNSAIQENIVTLKGAHSRGFDGLAGHNNIAWNTFTVRGDLSTGVSLSSGAQFNVIEGNWINTSGNWTYGVYAADGFNNITMNQIAVNGSWSHGVSIAASGTGSSQVYSNTIYASGDSSVGIYSNYYNSTISLNTVSVDGPTSYGIDSLALGTISLNNVTVNGLAAYGIYSSMNDKSINRNLVNVTGSSATGLYITNAYNLEVSSNSVFMDGGYATASYYSGTYSTFSRNAFNGGLENGVSINIKALSNNNKFLNNSFTFSSTGLKSSSTTGNLFVGNSFINDTQAFNIGGYSSNKYYHNSFVNYSSFIISPSTTSIWDNGYPSGGNFWSKYTGVDLFSGPGQNISGPDGIGDTQFNLSGSNIDHYPLMQKWISPSAVFIETGLAQGTQWYVTFDGKTVTSSNDTISFDILNAVHADYAYSVADIWGYNITANGSGIISYTGQGITTNVDFTVYVPPPKTYSVTFTENGLPSGTLWNVTLDSVKMASTNSAITFVKVNGTYSFAAGMVSGYSPSPGSGSVTVNGNSQDVLIQYSVVNYSVNFTSAGLPTGTSWSIAFNGSNKATASSEISFEAANGTYNYIVGSVPGYSPVIGSGTVSVNGSDQQIQVQFAVVSYTVNFNAVGLPSAQSWSITFNGTTKSTTTTSLSFDVSNGTYSYKAGIVPGYSPETGSGQVTVNGQNREVNIQFSKVTYKVTFNSIGLPSGTTWYVNFSNGNSFSSNTSSITVNLANGTYSYTIGNVTGYSVANQSGNVTVSGSSPGPVAIHFDKTPGPSGLPFWLYIVIGIIVGAAATAIGVTIYYRRK